MDDGVTQLAQQLLSSGLTGLSERERRVIIHIAKRLHVARDVNAVLEEQQTFGQRLADRVAQLGGSWTFIVVFTGMLLATLSCVILVQSGLSGARGSDGGSSAWHTVDARLRDGGL